MDNYATIRVISVYIYIYIYFRCNIGIQASVAQINPDRICNKTILQEMIPFKFLNAKCNFMTKNDLNYSITFAPEITICQRKPLLPLFNQSLVFSRIKPYVLSTNSHKNDRTATSRGIIH